MSRALPDPALVTAAKAAVGHGNEDAALDGLCKAWLPHVYAWCHRLGGPKVDPEDAAHEVLIIVCRRLDRVRAPEAFPSWVYGITGRVLANHRRRAWMRRWVPGASLERASNRGCPEQRAEAKQSAEIVWRALDQLPANQRDVLVLCELEERTGTEVAGLLGIPVGTVKSRLRAAREAFREAVSPAGPVAAGVG